MPAFGCNSITSAFARKVLNEPTKGFRLSDRVVSALDRFIGALTRFLVPGQPGVMTRWLYIYPFVGASDWTHALNLADVDGDFEKFQITWSGAVIHNDFGVSLNGGSGNTNCDLADVAGNAIAWNRRSHGLYSRTNSQATSRDLNAAFVEPRNGYTYICGMHPRYTDGNCYAYLNYYSKTGVTTVPNTITVAVADSLGLFSDNQRGPYYGTSHYLYKRGAYIGADTTAEVGMGYGTGPPTYMILSGNRSIAFLFSTKHPQTLEGPMKTDGTGGQMPGNNTEFNLFVEQLQVALARNV